MPRHKYIQIDSTDNLATWSVSFPPRKAQAVWPIVSPILLQLTLDWVNSRPLLPLSLPRMHKHALSLAQIVHDVTPGPATTPMTIFPPASFTHPSTLVVFVRARSRSHSTPRDAVAWRITAPHSKKCANASAAGRLCGGMLRRKGSRWAVGGIRNGRSLPPWRARTG